MIVLRKGLGNCLGGESSRFLSCNLTDIEALHIFGWRVFNLPVFPDSRPGAEVSE